MQSECADIHGQSSCVLELRKALWGRCEAVEDERHKCGDRSRALSQTTQALRAILHVGGQSAAAAISHWKLKIAVISLLCFARLGLFELVRFF
jgi:hypothetical protein